MLVLIRESVPDGFIYLCLPAKQECGLLRLIPFLQDNYTSLEGEHLEGRWGYSAPAWVCNEFKSELLRIDASLCFPSDQSNSNWLNTFNWFRVKRIFEGRDKAIETISDILKSTNLKLQKETVLKSGSVSLTVFKIVEQGDQSVMKQNMTIPSYHILSIVEYLPQRHSPFEITIEVLLPLDPDSACGDIHNLYRSSATKLLGEPLYSNWGTMESYLNDEIKEVKGVLITLSSNNIGEIDKIIEQKISEINNILEEVISQNLDTLTKYDFGKVNSRSYSFVSGKVKQI